MNDVEEVSGRAPQVRDYGIRNERRIIRDFDFYAKTLISVFQSTAIIKPLFLFYDSRLYILAKDSV
jgi:hypothetical protein